MIVASTRSEFVQARGKISAPLAFVPTMGALHEGHVALLRRARDLADQAGGKVGMSIFVNPTQFGPSEDFSSYPRTLDADVQKARDAGVDLLFAPQDPAEVYPDGKRTVVFVQELDQPLCGAGRPGHFQGVCTVVLKLWQLFRPRWGVFGEKDYQQLAILRQMHRDLFLEGEIVGHPIVREADGLAMSSRNLRLDPQSRKDALEIVALLRHVQQRFAQGIIERQALLEGCLEAMSKGQVEYCELLDAGNLRPVSSVDAPALLAIAARYGGVRLIDNCVLDPASKS